MHLPLRYPLKSFLVSTVVMILLDAAYLYMNRRTFDAAITRIQKTPVQLRQESALACYAFLSVGLWYLVLRTHRSFVDACLLGVMVYGVYETTMYAAFKNWPLSLVIMDTIWGAVLFGATTHITYALV